MLLYETKLLIRGKLDAKTFVNLIIKWNQESPHRDTVIKNIAWNGESNVRYTNGPLSLAIQLWEERELVAARFEKKEQDGAIWDTDFVADFSKKEVVIQLSRSYTERALMEDLKFSVPYFLSLLIDGGYLQDDVDLPISRNSILIKKENVDLLKGLAHGEKLYKLPVVYISCYQNNEVFINEKYLCRQLKGIAHILMESDCSLDGLIRRSCCDKNAYGGAIDIYYPNGTSKRFFKSPSSNREAMSNVIIRNVLRYMNSQHIPNEFTWDGFTAALLLASDAQRRQEIKRIKQDSKENIEKYVDAFDQENKALKEKVQEQNDIIQSLKAEIQGLNAKLASAECTPAVNMANEKEFYVGEITGAILEAIVEARDNVQEHTRRADILDDILQFNNQEKVLKILEDRRQEVKKIFKDYKRMTPDMRKKLSNLGFDITEFGKHYRLKYYNDNRYVTTVAKTGSDCREGKNIASVIIKGML